MTLENRLSAPPNQDILYEHLGYSIDLLAMALREIGEPPHTEEMREWFRTMSIIEVFWGQARLLIEFFDGSPGSETTTAGAHFTKKPIQYDFAFGDKDIEKMMYDQIAHLNNDRTADRNKKLLPEDMWRVGSAIGRALNLLVENLTDDSKETWEHRISGFQKIDADFVYVSDTVDASSAAPQIQTTISTSIAPKLNIIGPKGPNGQKEPI